MQVKIPQKYHTPAGKFQRTRQGKTLSKGLLVITTERALNNNDNMEAYGFPKDAIGDVFVLVIQT